MRVTEYLEIEQSRWRCARCGHDLGDAHEIGRAHV